MQPITIRRDGDDVIIDGSVTPVESGAQAGYFLVTGMSDGGMTQVLVPASAAGVTIKPLKAIDVTRRFAKVDFAGVRAPASALVGGFGRAGAQVSRQIQNAAVILTAESVGAMDAAFDMTVDWAFNRYTFGRALASYQALKHRFADMKSWLEASHAVSDAAAAAVGEGAAMAAELASAAKSYIGVQGVELAQDCVQMHGGIGVTYEHDLHFFLRRDHARFAALWHPGRAQAADCRHADQSGEGGMSEEIESVEAFRARARAWIKANLGPMQGWDMTQHCENDDEERKAVARDRALQRKLFDGGFAGICFPKEYGGQGLTPDHNRAFNEELAGHEYPSRFAVPTFSPCASTLLEFGTAEQKAAHLPAILKGDEVWVQLLSEPGGGSDVAGITTGAVRNADGDWILNGSKVWTSRAWWADWGLILVRTNWDVPKHSGMSVFIMPLHQPGVEIHRIVRLNGESEACQEFFTDVRIPDSDRMGEVDAGWTIGQRWMYHERLGHNSPYVSHPIGGAKHGRTRAIDRRHRPQGGQAGRSRCARTDRRAPRAGYGYPAAVAAHRLRRRLRARATPTCPRSTGCSAVSPARGARRLPSSSPVPAPACGTRTRKARPMRWG